MILVGLRNTEEKYNKTRHNAGAILLTQYVNFDGGELQYDKYSNCSKSKVLDDTVYLPNTFMNLSGESVVKIVKNENLKIGEDLENELFVFVDDVTMPVGKFKISKGEGASSHNGIKSIIQSLGGNNTFVRVRIGVGKVFDNGKLYEPGPEKMSDFVLSNFSNLEIVQIKNLSNIVMNELRKSWKNQV